VLAKRNFVAIDAEAFLSKPEQLHYFDVSYNRISELPADHIGRLSNLVELYLNNNNLTAIPESIEYLVKYARVATLHLRNLANPNSARLSLRSLKKLTVNHNQLTTLPAGIIKLRALEVLQADHNELAALPRNIGMLNRLTLLTLGSNKISTLPEQLRLLKRLTTLDLAENRFHDLPDFVCTLPLLTTFEVQGNPFKEIPDEIVAQGGKRVLEYIRMRDTGSTSVYRMKLMLVGQGNVRHTMAQSTLCYYMACSLTGLCRLVNRACSSAFRAANEPTKRSIPTTLLPMVLQLPMYESRARPCVRMNVSSSTAGTLQARYVVVFRLLSLFLACVITRSIPTL